MGGGGRAGATTIDRHTMPRAPPWRHHRAVTIPAPFSLDAARGGGCAGSSPPGLGRGRVTTPHLDAQEPGAAGRRDVPSRTTRRVAEVATHLADPVIGPRTASPTAHTCAAGPSEPFRPPALPPCGRAPGKRRASASAVRRGRVGPVVPGDEQVPGLPRAISRGRGVDRDFDPSIRLAPGFRIVGGHGLKLAPAIREHALG